MSVSVSLSKGGNVSLSKDGQPLRRVVVACGWDVSAGAEDFDLDLSAAGVDASGRVPAASDPTDPDYQNWLVWANHRLSADGCIGFMGDNRTGEGEGDDEQIEVDLASVPTDIDRIVFAVVIWHAEEKGGQTFGQVQNAFIRVFDQVTGQEITRYNLGAEFSDETLMVFGELYRRGGEWKFRAIGQGYDARTYQAEYGIAHEFHKLWARYAH